MTSPDIVKQYLDAWNAHDAEAIVETFAADGTYHDPTTGEISGESIAANAKRLWSAFPDLSFEIVNIAEIGPDRVIAEWLMRGTNSASFQGLPPTGNSVSLPGVDVVEIGVDGMKSVKGYFDTRVVPDQLGLQVFVQPSKVGPFSFGNSTAVQSGKKIKPGAFGITTIWNSEDQTEEIRVRTRDIAKEMLSMEGFIGVSVFRIGGRGVTISAWEKPEQAKRLLRGGNHKQAMRKFWAELGDAAFTSVWIPDHINPFWVRCTTCGKMNDYYKKSGVCDCGQQLPEVPAYF
jgi:steroid delta-isomerase-like uncharacterized protein